MLALAGYGNGTVVGDLAKIVTRGYGFVEQVNWVLETTAFIVSDLEREAILTKTIDLISAVLSVDLEAASVLIRDSSRLAFLIQDIELNSIVAKNLALLGDIIEDVNKASKVSGLSNRGANIKEDITNIADIVEDIESIADIKEDTEYTGIQR
jgi:hypothetical protein